MDIRGQIIRSATLENGADENGVVDVPRMAALYAALSAPICITGFVAVSADGRAMQAHQAGIFTDEQARAWRAFVVAVRARRTGPCALVMQLAHAGLQTTRPGACAPSAERSPYFRTPAREMTADDIRRVSGDFAAAARRALEAGFDGVQIHAAHGYLIHQFLSPRTNRRRDRYADGALFLEEVVAAVRAACPPPFAVGLKVSGADDDGLTPTRLAEALKRVDGAVDFVEVSYGTMAQAMNIFRGGCPVDDILAVNPLYNRYPKFLRGLWKRFAAQSQLRRFKPFTPCYNLAAALEIKKAIRAPVILVGGIRSGADIRHVFSTGLDAVALCRPFICEPDFAARLRRDPSARSACTNCNRCAVFCDSGEPTRCRQKGKDYAQI